MDKKIIEQLIHTKSKKLSFKVNKGKSAIWRLFQLVYVDEKFVNFVKCNACDGLLRWKSRDGTNGLRGHTDSCKKKEHLQKLTDMKGLIQGSSSTTQLKLSPADKYELSDVLVMMCAQDIRPFAIVDGQGFKNVAKQLLALGARYGSNLLVDSAMPCSTTISRHLHNLAQTQRDILAKELRDIQGVGVTTDMWTHRVTNMPYITVTSHFIDKNWVLQGHILATRPLEESHTGANIKAIVDSILKEFEASHSSNIYVTDNASNIKCAFKDDNWISCTGHNLNLIVTHTLDPKSKDLETDTKDFQIHEAVIFLIDTCKEIVTRVKRTHLQSQLDLTLKQEVATRWNSVLTMLKSIRSNLTALRSFATLHNDRALSKLLLDLVDDSLEDIINVLEPFDTATKIISQDKTLTFHLVLAIRKQLNFHLIVKPNDSEIVAGLKKRCAHFLALDYRISPLHNIATLLDPRIKGNQELMSSAERQKAISDLKDLVNDVPNGDVSTELASSSAPSIIHDNNDFFCELFTPIIRVNDEVNIYLVSADTCDDLLSYWKIKANVWPRLSKIAKYLLAIPATETSSERAFSTAGRTIENRRSDLSLEHVDDLLFLHGLHKH